MRSVVRHRVGLLTCVIGVIAPAVPAYPAEATASAQAAAFFERAFQENLEHSPEFQTVLGLKTDQDKWDDRSDAAAIADLARSLRQLAELKRTIDYDALDRPTRLSYRLFERERERAVRGFPFRHHHYVIDQTGGPFNALPALLINRHAIDAVEDARAYIARLRRFETVLAQITANLDRQADMGIIPPRWVFPRATAIGRNVISGAPFEDGASDSPLWADFQAKVAALADVDADTRSALLADARSALLESVGPAIRRLLARWAEVEKLATDDDGVWKLPDGAAFYDYMLEEMTTTDLNAEQIHAIGRQEVARIHDEILALRPRLGFTGDLPALFRHVREHEGFYLPDTPDGRQEYLVRATAVVDEMRSRLDELFVRRPHADIIVRATEAYREATAPKAFYEMPAPNGVRPGVYYVTLHNMREMPTYQLAAIAYHEGIPGHHMQIAIAQELRGLPRFRRFGGHAAYIEGWGLYAERLPKEIGLYQDPWADFGRLSSELWRAVRLVVDTGIHARRWTRQQAIDYFAANSALSRDEAVREVERYIMWPGQATAYKIGMLKILELRELARRELGERFDLRKFHDVILRDGSLPLDVLEEQVRAWIAES